MTKLTWVRKVGAVIVVAGFLLAGSEANANTISLVNFGAAVPGGIGSNWTYEYSFANSYLVTGDSYFTINDFGTAVEVVPPTGPAASWVLQPQTFTGYNEVAPLAPGDHPSVLNVTYLWMGATGPVADSTFTFTLSSPNTVLTGETVAYTTGDQNSNNPSLPSYGLGNVLAPGVPDGGSTAMLLGSVLFAFGAIRRKFNGR